MTQKLGKFICVFIILAAIALGIACILAYPTSPYRNHPLFPSVMVLFVTAEIILMTAAVVCLKALGMFKKKNNLGSTFYLNQQISESSDNANNKSFQKRAALYDIKKELNEIVEHQKEILVAKQEIIQLLMLLNEAIEHHDAIEIIVTQNLIDSIKQKTAILEEKMERFFSPPKVQHYEHVLQNINSTALVSKPSEFKKTSLPEKEKMVILDKKIYTRILKELKDFVKSNKTYLAVLTLELNLLVEKITQKKSPRGKTNIADKLKLLYDVTHEQHAEHSDVEEKPTPSNKPKLH